MSKFHNTDEGSIKPDYNNALNGDHTPLNVDINCKRSSVKDCSEDVQTSPPMSKKARLLSSLTGGDVLGTVKQAVLSSGSSVSEKQHQISQMIAELQSLQQNLGTGASTKFESERAEDDGYYKVRGKWCIEYSLILAG